jgi:AcrR family transcriptional regulator
MTRDPKQPYHHGQLSKAALDQALETVRHGGAQALSIRRLAETLGVAHRAIYNHYADRAALLRSVAARGFSELADHLAKADGRVGFIAAYCHFALTNPGLYDLMMVTPNESVRASP